MALFCSEFAWCSPREFAALTIEEYEQLRQFLIESGKVEDRAG